MSSTTRIVDLTKNIIEIVWEQKAQPEDFDRITHEIKGYAEQLGGTFDVIVDIRGVKAFIPESRAKLVEHQKALLDFGMKRAAVVVAGAVAKVQLSRTARESEHTTETHWESYEEALQFLRG